MLEYTYNYKLHIAFQNLMEDLIITKAAQQKTQPKKAENVQNQDCEGNEIAV